MLDRFFFLLYKSPTPSLTPPQWRELSFDSTCPCNTQTLPVDQRILIRREAPKSTIVSRGAYCERGAGKRSRDPAITRQIISPLAGSVIRFCLPGGVKKEGASRFPPLPFVVSAMYKEGKKLRKKKPKQNCASFTICDLVQPSVANVDTQMLCH